MRLLIVIIPMILYASIVNAQETFISDPWEDGNFNRWINLQFEPGGATIVEDVVRFGRRSVKIVVNSGDTPIPSAERAELSVARHSPGGPSILADQGDTKFIALSTRLESDWQNPGWAITWQMLQGGSGWNNPAMSLHASAGGWFLQTNGGDRPPSGKAMVNHTLTTALNPGQWTDFVFEIYYHPDDGTVKAWVREEGETVYTEVLNVATPTLQRSPGGAVVPGVYKRGLYRTSTPWTNTLWHDGFAIGTTFDAVVADPGVVVDPGGTVSIVIENDDPETSSTGRWRYWTGREAHEGSLRYGLPGQVNTYRFTPDIPQSGQYRIYTQWLAQPEQSRQVDYDIQHSTGLDTVPVNQQQNGGQWNELGVFTLSAGSGNFVEISDRNGIYAIADVVRFDLVAAPPTPDPELCPKPVETELLLCRADLARIQSELGQSQIDLNDQIHRLLDIQGVLDR